MRYYSYFGVPLWYYYPVFPVHPYFRPYLPVVPAGIGRGIPSAGQFAPFISANGRAGQAAAYIPPAGGGVDQRRPDLSYVNRIVSQSPPAGGAADQRRPDLSFVNKKASQSPSHGVQAEPQSKQALSDGNHTWKSKKKPEDFIAAGLSQQDIDVLVSMYGDDIENVYDLSAGQKWMLDQSDRADSAFFLQVMMRAVIHLDPPSFRRKVDSVSEKRDSLRSAFVTEGLSRPVRVVLKNRRVELLFKDITGMPPDEQEEYLSKAAESDRRQGFDMAKDPLLRIACYKTDDKDHFVFLISQPHIISDGFSLMLLLKDIFLSFASDGTEVFYGGKKFAESDLNYEQWLRSRDTRTELDYWKEALRDLPPFAMLPGREPSNMSYAKHTLVMNLGAELSSKLESLQGPARASISVIMQAAWTALLMRIRETNDVTYGLVTAGRDAEMADSLKLTGGFINVVPIRPRTEQDTDMGALVGIISSCQVEALKNSHCSIREIQNAVSREEPVFDHLLNFQNFTSIMGAGPEAGLGMDILDIRTYDNLSEDLCIYFRKEGSELICDFSYNSSAITKNAIGLLAEGYQKVLSQLAEKGLSVKISELAAPAMGDFIRLKSQRGAVLLQTVSRMRRLRAFQGIEDPVLWDILRVSDVHTYQDNDQILSFDQRLDSVLFLLSGKVTYSGVNSGGWLVPIRTISEGSLLDASALWNGRRKEDGKRKTLRSIAAQGDEVSVLSVPLHVMNRLFMERPVAAVNLLMELNESVHRMETLWMTV